MKKMTDLHFTHKYKYVLLLTRSLKLAITLLMVLWSVSGFATHIVGGDLTYRCLGNDQYEVTLMFYRDCFGANPEADFDDPASIAIYDSKNNLQIHLGVLGQILINFNADDTIRLESDCFIDGQGVCVHRTIYRKVVQLPFLKGGYQLVYQRCCRNASLTNIVDPLLTGATWVAEISEQALAECNSSPEFREWPPIFVCTGEALSYDHSAVDSDGDSLVYRLCAPFMGGSINRPIPQPASRPPYDEVIFKSPYSVDNLLGGDVPLAIDQSGIITGQPTAIGQYLVGVCVEEYRNGVLIGSIRRDFEYNVVDCETVVLTQFTVDTAIVCADVADVTITDNSIGVPEDAPYMYTVTSDKGLNLKFNEPDVTFQVNGRQTLTITQSVMVSDVCTESKTQTILIDVEDTGLGFNDTIVVCEGSSIALNPNFNPRYTYTWSPTTYLSYIDDPNPIAEPAESITYFATVYDPILNCTITESVHVDVIANPGVTADFEVRKTCGSLKLTFINTSTGADTFIWTFGDRSNPGFVSNEKDPMYTYPSGGTYDVVLTIPGDECNTIRTKRLAVTGDDFVDFTATIEHCGPSLIDLDIGLNPLYVYQWEPDPRISDVTAAIPEVYLREDANFKVTVTDPLNDSCTIEVIVNVLIDNQLVVDLGDTLYVCEPGPVQLNPNGNPDLIWEWSPAEPLDDPTSHNPTADITENIRFVAKITDPTDSTCVVRIPLYVKIGLDDGGFEDGDSLFICDSSSFFLNPGANPNLVYSWSPTTGLDDPTHPNPIASPLENTAYTATISDSSGMCTITKTIYITIVDSDVLMNFDEEKECNSLEVRFINQSRGATNFIWTFGDPTNPGFMSTEENPTYTYPVAGTYDVELKSNDDPNCLAVRAKRITLTGDDFVPFEKTISNCGPSLIDLNTGLNPLYKYQWDPHPLISDVTAAIPEVYAREDVTFKVTVIDPLNDSCVVEGTVNVLIGDQLVVDLGDTLHYCEIGPIPLNPNGDPELIYEWTPAELLDDPTSYNPSANMTGQNVRFVARIEDPNDSTCVVRIPLYVKYGLDDGGFEDGDSLFICDSSSFFLNPGANPNLVYSWSPTTGLDDPTHPNPIASPLENTAYTATISDSSGMCTIMKTIYITIVDSDVLMNFDEEKECNSLEVRFINQSRGATNFIWTFGDPTNPGFISTEENPTYTYPVAGTYDVELKSNDDPNCLAVRAKRITITGDDFVDFADTIYTCDVRSIPLNPNRNPNYIYAWKADPAISDTTAANPVVSLREPRTFMVTVTDPLNDTCTIMGTVAVFPDDRLVRDLADSILACMPGEVQLNPNGNAAFTYQWAPAELLDDPTSFNPTATITETTVFSVTIVDPADETCRIETELKVVLAEYVKLITSDSVTMACPGDTVIVTAKVELLDSWSWLDPSGNVLGMDSSLTVVLTTSGYYRIRGMVGPCVYEDSIFLGVRTLQFDLSKEEMVCPDEPVDIIVTNTTDFQIDSIIWSPADDIVLGQGGERVTVRPEMTSTYFATVYYEDGCVATDSITVEVSDLDRFMVTADPDTIFFGESSTLTATLEQGATYSWTPSDVLQTPTSNTTVAVPDQTTTFTVEITDAGGCTATKQVTVVVIIVQCEPPFLFMPNAFSPNNDNENDVLYVRGKYIQEMDLFIYDRWGEKVFESHDPNQGWDGTFRDKLLAPDVYGYYLRILCIGGDQHIEKGNVTILH